MSSRADTLIIPQNEPNPFLVTGELHYGVGQVRAPSKNQILRANQSTQQALPDSHELTEQDTETIKNTASLIRDVPLESLAEAKTKGFELAYLLNKFLSKHDIDPANAKIFIENFLRGAEAVLTNRDDTGNGERISLAEKATDQGWDVRDFEEEEYQMRHMSKEEAFQESEKYMLLSRFAETATGLVSRAPVTAEDVRAVALFLGEQVAMYLKDVPFFVVERFIGTTWYSGHRLVGYRAHVNGAKAREAENPREKPTTGLFTPWDMAESPGTSGGTVSPASNVPFDLFRWAEEM
jgi:hypothetical protein